VGWYLTELAICTLSYHVALIHESLLTTVKDVNRFDTLYLFDSTRLDADRIQAERYLYLAEMKFFLCLDFFDDNVWTGGMTLRFEIVRISLLSIVVHHLYTSNVILLNIFLFSRIILSMRISILLRFKISRHSSNTP